MSLQLIHKITTWHDRQEELLDSWLLLAADVTRKFRKKMALHDPKRALCLLPLMTD
jgi:hypothetical protein